MPAESDLAARLEEAKQAAEKVRFLVLDVDGICTDGKLSYLPDGSIVKSFSSQDGLGITSAMASGLGVGVITGRDDPGVCHRMQQLGIAEYHPGFSSKLPPLETICRNNGLSFDQLAYMGDDWIDLDPMRVVGLPISVANGRPDVRAEALYVTRARGGDGAVREAIEFIFACRGEKINLADLWAKMPRVR